MNQSRLRTISKLAGPICIGLIAAVANPMMDTMMLARFSVDELAALSVASGLYVTVYVGLYGVIHSLTPTLAECFGAGQFRRAGFIVIQGVYLALAMSAIGMVPLIFSGPILEWVGIPQALVPAASRYLEIMSVTLPLQLVFLVYGALNNAMGRPVRVMAVQLTGMFVKIPLNTVFVFGLGAVPAMGSAGCAVATVTITAIQVVIAFFVLQRPLYTQLDIFRPYTKPDMPTISTMLRLGLPIGFNSFCKITTYTLMAFFIAQIGIMQVAGHQIVANLANFVYILPLAFANAACVLVAHAVGAGDHKLALGYIRSGLLVSFGISLTLAVVLAIFRDPIIGLYTSDASVSTQARPLMLILSFIIVCDGVQVLASYVLRAYRVVFLPAVMYFVTMWCIGIIGGYALGFRVSDALPAALSGPPGFWIALAAGVAILGIAMPLLAFREQASRATGHSA